MLSVSGDGEGVMEWSGRAESTVTVAGIIKSSHTPWLSLLILILLIRMFDVVLDMCFLEGTILGGVFKCARLNDAVSEMEGSTVCGSSGEEEGVWSLMMPSEKQRHTCFGM